MKIEELYKEFQKLVEEDKIYLHERYNNAELFLAFRKSYGIRLKDHDEQFLINILHDKEWQWFVPSVLRVLEAFPIRLLKELIKTAVYTKDPSFNNNFIDPCIRVHDVFPVNDLLIEYLKFGTKEEKIGALQAFYWVRPHITTVSHGENFDKHETFGFNPKWNVEGNSYDCPYDIDKMTEEEFAEYSAAIEKMNQRQIEALLHEFHANEDIDVRYQISLCLPGTIKEFPEAFSDQAVQYFKLKNSNTIPDNWNDLENIKKTKHSFLRRLKYFFMNLKNKQFEMEGLITLKRK